MDDGNSGHTTGVFEIDQIIERTGLPDLHLYPSLGPLGKIMTGGGVELMKMHLWQRQA